MEAETALRHSVKELPEKLQGRLDTAENLSDEDRTAIIDSVRSTLARFQKQGETMDKS
jgi:hypothetical protein